MDHDRFWHLIEDSRIETTNCDEQAEKLTALLGKLDAEEITGFQQQFDQRRDEAFRWDLWAVAYIVNGGCSDDSFADFSCWLIGQGRDYFEAALKDPQRAADNVDVEAPEESECEALMYCAMNAYEAKTGQSEMPRKASGAMKAEPSGEDWDEEDLPERFPALCKKFGFE